MLLPRITRAIEARTGSLPSSSSFTCTSTIESPSHLRRPCPVVIFYRSASHQSQRSVNGPKGGPGKALGAKKSGEQYVIPGHIIFRQRGSKWFPGTNAGMGRDHTIYALQAGYVKYYRDPARHPKRKYIGVAFERDHKLPYPPNAPRHRRLGMIAVPREVPTPSIPPPPTLSASEPTSPAAAAAAARSALPTTIVVKSRHPDQPDKTLRLRAGYMYCESNYDIGRVADQAPPVRKWRRNNRFLAWRIRAARYKRRLARRALFKSTRAAKKKSSSGAGGGGGGKKKRRRT